MSLAFSLCRQPRYEDRIRDAIDACVGLLVERLAPPALRAVVLTGSFARGEGSVLPRGEALHVLGDLEFFVVVDGVAHARRLTHPLAEWGREASARLTQRGVRAAVEFGPIEQGFFAHRARPSIFVHDLRQHGKTLWGDRAVVERIPPFDPAAIPREDALHLLFNRTIEQLDVWDRLDGMRGDALLEAAYQRVKLTLDLAGSALAFVGGHVALYRRRPAEFARLVAETPSLAALLPPAFAVELAQAARVKLDPASAGWPPDGPSTRLRRRLRRQIADAAPATIALLAWELTALLDGEPLAGSAAEALPSLLARYARTPALTLRLWDWTRTFVNPRPAPLPIAHARMARLALVSTPRALLYVAGALAYLALAGRGDRRLLDAHVASALPLARADVPREPGAQRRAIVALWKWCVRNN
jgi:hypothetical protein